jgi:hypothetical protein
MGAFLAPDFCQKRGKIKSNPAGSFGGAFIGARRFREAPRRAGAQQSVLSPVFGQFP